ncbi:MAG: FAD/NAD(P)-binding protein, partial [Rhodopirellula sp. JB055]|uniref:FAD/NAD(P)-binding protein n=1 Tax=Rhodopirellula sp. JB055 TaxID=3342846 RepID=UPI003709C9AA
MSVAISGGSVVDYSVTNDNSNETRTRLAIVGCGPRGLQCLDALSQQLSTKELSRMEITVFEPSPFPGAGCIYDPKQPRMLRMNFATQHIDFWKVESNQPTPRSGSLIG